MLRLACLSICLVCACHGRRMQISSEGPASARKVASAARSSGKVNELTLLKSLAAVLLAHNHLATESSPTRSGVQFGRGPHQRSGWLALRGGAKNIDPALPAYGYMEPPVPPPDVPQIKKPRVGKNIVTLGSKVLLVSAALGGMSVAFPDLLAQICLQIICFFGSFLEPFESFLPERGPLRALVTTVQKAKKAYNEKHGLMSMDESTFFDSEDDLDSDDSESPSSEEAEEQADVDDMAVEPVDDTDEPAAADMDEPAADAMD
mmetsp:Transcript_79583/g.131657  ORF Transcript_79583/g.131657 Transcript_79583/m.131657 type:complete len:262 (-) Transcript_79583:49-834(-)